MAAHRYWRAVALEAYGAGDLELSAFQLLDAAGVRVDAPATLTASTAPATGAVASLQDTDLTTSVRWAASSLAALTLTWDFGGSPVDVFDVQLGGPDLQRFLYSLNLQYSDDGAAWTSIFNRYGYTWPGADLKSELYKSDAWSPTDKATTITLDASLAVATIGINPSSAFIRGGGMASQGVRQFEVVVGAVNAGYIGVASKAGDPRTQGLNGAVEAWSWAPATATKWASGVPTAYGSASALGDVIGATFDFATGNLTFYKNGVSLGVAFTITPRELYPAFGGNSTGVTGTIRTRDFAFPVAGAQPWTGAKAALRTGYRTHLSQAFAVGTGPPITYGIPQFVEPVDLTVQSGSVKDFTTGVLGTGRGRVAGTVKERGTPTNTPVYRKVRLIRERDGLLIRELWSNPVTGAYSFDYVDELQTFTVLSYYHTGAFRAVVADGQIPELMP